MTDRTNGTEQEARHKKLVKQNIQACTVQLRKKTSLEQPEGLFVVTVKLTFRGIYADRSTVSIELYGSTDFEQADAEGKRIATYYEKLLKR